MNKDRGEQYASQVERDAYHGGYFRGVRFCLVLASAITALKTAVDIITWNANELEKDAVYVAAALGSTVVVQAMINNHEAESSTGQQGSDTV